MAKPTDQSAPDLVPKVVRSFRGLSLYRNLASVPLDVATDLMNVIISKSGNLLKFRVPTVKTAAIGAWPSGNQYGVVDTFFDFQQALGTRQLFFNNGNGLGKWEGDIGPFAITKIDESPLYGLGRFDYADSNNLLFMCNGQVSRKWDGANLFGWGIAAPVVPPILGLRLPITSIQRTTNVVTVTFDGSSLPAGVSGQSVQLDIGKNGVHANQMNGTRTNDTIKIDSNSANPSFNGSFAISAHTGTFTIQYAQVGPNSGPFASGFITIYTVDCAGGASSIAQYARLDNISFIDFSNNQRVLPGEVIVVAGLTGSGVPLNGTWKTVFIPDGSTIATSGPAGWVAFSQVGHDIPVTAGGAGPPTAVGGFTDLLGPRIWAYSYKRSSTGEESTRSPLSTFIPTPSGNGLVSNVRAYLVATAPTDPQVDTIVWYGTLDAGGDLFKIAEFPISNGLFFGDGRDDSLLDKTTRASLINDPPPIGKYLVKWGGRIFIAGIVGALQDIAFTGLEKIVVGRPESVSPPNNRLRLSIGADDIKGMSATPSGLVAWSHSDQMFVYKGVVEDITVAGPINFTSFLEELPWRTGITSHFTAQFTPYGTVWRSGDQSVKMWNGLYYGDVIGPRTLTDNVIPLMQSITSGTESNEQSVFFNWLDRDWYALLIAVNGSTTPNRIMIIDLDPSYKDNLGIFLSDIPADAIGVREDANASKHLLISQNGRIYEIKAASTAVNGINRVKTSTTSQLFAYWTSGYEGSDSPFISKFYRYGKLVTDQDGFSLITRVVDDENTRLRDNPNQQWSKTFSRGKGLSRGGAFETNRRGRRQQFTIIFPDADTDASVLELSTSYIPLAEFNR